MKWNKQQKIAAGLLGLAVAAFLGDRFVLGGGSAAEDYAIAPTAGADQTPMAPATDASPNASLASSNSLPMAALARKMEEICAAEGLKPGHSGDAFSPPAAWFPAPVAVDDAPAGPVMSSRAADFRSKYKLTAVMRGGPRGENSLAVIHGDTVRVGQTFRGFAVKAIRERSVLLSDGVESFELELPEPGFATAN